jgi:hypothetical protein
VTSVPDQSTFFHGDTVVVTAVANTGWAFSGWSDGLTGNDNPDTLIMTSDTTVTASFWAMPRTITAIAYGQGAITLEPDQDSYIYGDTVITTAVPDPGYAFDTWAGDLTTNENPETLIVTGDMTVEAYFELEPTGVGDDVPRETALLQNRPNPFNPTTTIEYALAAGCRVSLRIYDVRGQLVRTLVDGEKDPGTYAEVWDGRNNRGESVATGVYIYRLRAGEMVFTRKAILLK